MTKKAEKFGFVRRDPYDLSQSSLGIAHKVLDLKRDPKTAASASSYTVSARPSKEAVKRIKLR